MRQIFNKYLSDNSKTKLEQIDYNKTFNLNHNLKELLGKMIESSMIDLNVSPDISDIQNIKNIFIDFDKEFNKTSESKFISDIKKMNLLYAVKLYIFNDVIKINFLVINLEESIGYISSVLHALHTFCYTFPYSYNHLTINISLDDNYRDVEWHTKIPEIFDLLRKKSAAFNVSGVTQRNKKIINLTKKEEIIKLMYHEMIHFIGLDHELINMTSNFQWAIESPGLNFSEAYTEFLSVILYSAYNSIQLGSISPINIEELYGKILSIEIFYSAYLTCNILKFYGYNNKTFINFFRGIGKKNSAPIYIWEYVILRTQLLLNLEKVASLIGGKNMWRINSKTNTEIIDLMKIDDNMIEILAYYFTNTTPIKNISYTLISLKWNIV